MVYAQPRICPGKWDALTPQGFWDTNGSPNLRQTIRPYNNKKTNKQKWTCIIVDFAVPADHRVKLKESRKIGKYLARELKKLWNIKVTVIPIVISALGPVTKGLVQRLEHLEIRERVETIQTTALPRSTRILTRVLEIWGDLLSLKLQW